MQSLYLIMICHSWITLSLKIFLVIGGNIIISLYVASLQTKVLYAKRPYDFYHSVSIVCHSLFYCKFLFKKIQYFEFYSLFCTYHKVVLRPQNILSLS